MIITITFLIIGFFFLIKGADALVDGSSSIAKRFGVSDLVIGLTVVAFGTSAPELVVNIVSAVQGTPDIAIGNILGSNLANILLILGITAVIAPLAVQRSTTWKEIPFSLLAALAVGIMANDIYLNGAEASVLTRGDGFMLLGFFAIFLYYIFGSVKSPDRAELVEDMGIKKQSMAKSCLLVGGGLLALIIGGKWVVEGAVALATLWGLSEAVIGLTVVAIGTSLPELATSVVAAMKGKADIAIGNVIGSNIFNVFWILGVTAIIAELPFAPQSNFDIGAVLLATILLFLWMFIGKKHYLERWQGFVFIGLYAAYLVLLLTVVY